MKKKTRPQSNTPSDRIEQFAKYLLAFRKLQDQGTAFFLSLLGNLSMQELNVLNTIGDHEPCIMSEIAKQVSLSLSSVTLIVDKLVKRKLVNRIRSDEDRRIVRGTLTSEGKKIYQAQLEHMRKVIETLFSTLTHKEQDDLLKIFFKFSQAIT